MNDDIPVDELLDGLDDDLLADDDRVQPLPDEIVAVNWRTLTDDDAAAAWAELADWVDWFVQRYQYNTKIVPACWYKHGDLVEELSALHTAWQVSYSALDGGYGPIGWHERLTVAIGRLASRYPSECTTGHSNPIKVTVATVGATDNFRDWARASHAQTS